MKPPRKKFLLALQMWEGDKAETCALARLLADMKDGKTYEHCDLLLVYRRDCPESIRTAQHCQEAFKNVFVYRTKRRETGFPGGPNGMWCDLMQHVARMTKDGKWNYSAVFTTEGDACPLVLDWDVQLLEEWESASAEGAVVMGAWNPMSAPGSKVGHINGNAFFDPQLPFIVPTIASCSAHTSWDVTFAPALFKAGWKESPLFWNEYQCKTMPAKKVSSLAGDGVVWLHGVKDSSVRDWLKAKISV